MERAEKIGEPIKGVIQLAVDGGTYLRDVAFDLGEWALRAEQDLKGFLVSTFTIGTSGYDVALTDREQFIPVAKVRWEDNRTRTARITLD